jgi:hypothetical protein
VQFDGEKPDRITRDACACNDDKVIFENPLIVGPLVATSTFIVTYVVKLPTSRLARNHFPVARDLGVVERMLRSQVRAAIFTVGLPRPRCTEDTGSGC